MARKVRGKSNFTFVEKLLTCLIAWFQFIVGNCQCKHILLGFTHQQELADVLTRYANDPIMSNRITLIALGNLAVDRPSQTSFEMINMPCLFVYDSTPCSAVDQNEEDVTLSVWRQYAANIPEQAAKYRPGASIDHDIPINWDVTKVQVLLNINDHRVDKPLAACDPRTEASMKLRAGDQMFCNWHYLRCGCYNKACNNRHGPILNEDELRVLAIWARRLRCNQLGRCRDPHCFYGHICPNLPNCANGRLCEFERTHNEIPSFVKIYRPRLRAGISESHL